MSARGTTITASIQKKVNFSIYSVYSSNIRKNFVRFGDIFESPCILYISQLQKCLPIDFDRGDPKTAEGSQAGYCFGWTKNCQSCKSGPGEKSCLIYR